jgi:hypothetical protein
LSYYEDISLYLKDICFIAKSCMENAFASSVAFWFFPMKPPLNIKRPEFLGNFRIKKYFLYVFWVYYTESTLVAKEFSMHFRKKILTFGHTIFSYETPFKFKKASRGRKFPYKQMFSSCLLNLLNSFFYAKLSAIAILGNFLNKILAFVHTIFSYETPLRAYRIR